MLCSCCIAPEVLHSSGSGPVNADMSYHMINFQPDKFSLSGWQAHSKPMKLIRTAVAMATLILYELTFK